jgi:hypothetical protein
VSELEFIQDDPEFEFEFDPFFDLDCDDINIIDMFADNGFGNLLFLRSLNLI